jgi:hypothetical protein
MLGDHRYVEIGGAKCLPRAMQSDVFQMLEAAILMALMIMRVNY